MNHAYIHSEVSRKRAPTTIARGVKDSASGLDDLDRHEAGDIFQMVIREVERPLLEVVMNIKQGAGPVVSVLNADNYNYPKTL